MTQGFLPAQQGKPNRPKEAAERRSERPAGRDPLLSTSDSRSKCLLNAVLTRLSQNSGEPSRRGSVRRFSNEPRPAGKDPIRNGCLVGVYSQKVSRRHRRRLAARRVSGLRARKAGHIS